MPSKRKEKNKAAPNDDIDIDALSEEESPLRRSPRRKKDEAKKPKGKVKAPPKPAPKPVPKKRKKQRGSQKEFGDDNVQEIDSVL